MLIKNKNFLVILFLWYLLPFFYLIVVKNIFLPKITLILILYFTGLFVGYKASINHHISSRVTFPKIDLISFIILVTILIQILGLTKFALEGLDIRYRRNEIFSNAYLLFGSSMLYTLYNSFLFPAIVCVIIYVFTYRNRKLDQSDIKTLVLCFLILIADTVLKLSRFPLMFLIFFLFFYNYKIGIKRKYFIVGAVMLILSSQMIVFFRQFYYDNAINSYLDVFTFEHFDKTIIGYQYYGYLLLDKMIVNKPVLGNPEELNCLAFVFYMLEILTTKFGVFISFAWENTNLLLSTGTYIDNAKAYINAFSTNFLPIYLDFGFIGILIFGLYSGFIFGYQTSSRLFMFIKHLFFFIMFFGIYQPIILFFYGLFVSPIFVLLFAKIQIHRQQEKFMEASRIS